MNGRWSRQGLTLIGLGSLLVQPACSGYGDLRRQMDDYRPPAVVEARMSPPAAPSVPEAATSVEDTAFAEQRAELEQQAGRWQQALSAPQPEDAFYTPSPALLASLGPGADDAALAANYLADGFSRETLEILALLRNPEVRAKKAAVRAAIEGYSQAEDLDTILRRYSGFTKGLMTGIGGMSNPDPVALRFPFPGVLALKGEVVGQEVKAALAELDIARREAVTAARKAYAELGYLRAAQDLSRSQLELLDSLESTVRTRYESAKAGFQELSAVAAERETMAERLTDLKEETKVRQAAIRSLLRLPEESAIGWPAALGEGARPLPGRERLLALAQERRQEIRQKEAMVERGERLLSLAETMIYPGLSQNLSLFDNDLVSRVGGEQTMTGETSFPQSVQAGSGSGLPQMPWFGSNEAYLRQSRAQLAGLRQELAALRAATSLGVSEVWFRFDKARRQERLYRDRLLPLAQASLDAGREGYAAGSIAFPALVQAANSWLSANLELARAQADLVAARAELAAAVGVDDGLW